MLKKASDLKPGDMVLCGGRFRDTCLRAVDRLTDKRVYVSDQEVVKFGDMRVGNSAYVEGYQNHYFSMYQDRVIVTSEPTARRALDEWKRRDIEIEELQARLSLALKQRKAAVLAIFAEDAESTG